MNTPFFSVVIPTKNRPLYLKESIQSVLWQDFKDYELIVSDNFNDERTLTVINEFKKKEEIKYYRTDKELNMIDHWEFATTKAHGRYVLVLPDRKLLYNGALKKLHNLIISQKEQFNCITYGVKCYDDINKQMLWGSETKKMCVFDSKHLIKNFLSKNYFDSDSLDIYFPKSLNSCYKNSFATGIRKKIGNYFNNKGVTSPDYSSFFINTLFNDTILFSGFPVLLSQGEHTSNGRNFGKGNIKNYMDTLGYINPYEFVPIKAPFIYSLLINDFLTIQKTTNKNDFTYHPVNYYFTNYFEYKKFKDDESGVNIAFMNEWSNALKNEPDEIRTKVNIAISEFNNCNLNRQPKVKVSQLHLHFRDYLKNNYAHYSLINKIVKHRFDTGLSAAGFCI